MDPFSPPAPGCARPPRLIVIAASAGGFPAVSRIVGGSANPLLESAARVYGRDVVAVILTGSGRDGTDGVQSVKRAGGMVIAEHESTAVHASMPLAARATGVVDLVLPLEEIAPTLMRLVDNHGVERAPVT